MVVAARAQVMGMTDIDDKIVRRAAADGTTPAEVAQRFEREFFADMRALGVAQPHVVARVSEHIPQIVDFVRQLIERR